MLERFFDEAGGMQLVIHSPYGSRINRAWGLALRKRFCRKFNFELQAAATEDNIVLSLTTAHSFELDDVSRYLHSASIRPLLIQALLDAPMFMTRWRWVTGVALALPRFRGGRKVPPQLARMGAEDLIASVFPDQIACAENLPGEREIPDHPLVRQTIDDCLNEAMDIDGLERLLGGIEAGDIRIVARDLTEPSPLALEVLSARPYAYLDDAPLEERRTQAVMARRWLAPEEASELGRLDADAIARVRAEAWPDATTPTSCTTRWSGSVSLRPRKRARSPVGAIGWRSSRARTRGAARCAGRVALDRGRAPAAVPGALAGGEAEPTICGAGRRPSATGRAMRRWSRSCAAASKGSARSRKRRLPPRSASSRPTSRRLGGAGDGRLRHARPLHAGRRVEEWCERRLLARIHRYTVKRLRAEIEPVAARDFLRFLTSGSGSRRMRGCKGPAPSTPSSASSKVSRRRRAPGRARSCRRGLPATAGLARRSLSGGACRLDAAAAAQRAGTTARAARRRCAPRRSPCWRAVTPPLGIAVAAADAAHVSPRAKTVADYIRQHGASFFDELVEGTGLLRSQVEEALAELVAVGLVSSDSFGGLRALLVPSPSAGRSPAPAAGAAPWHSAWRQRAAGRWRAARVRRSPKRRRHRRRSSRRRSSTSRARCCSATASCSGGCWNARPPGCRPGATCCASTAGSRAAAKSAAAALSPASPASNSRCPMRSACCAKSGASRMRGPWSRCPAPTRSISSAF